MANWNRHIRLLDAHLAQAVAHVCGATFTLADMALGLATQRWMNAPIAHDTLPAVAAWMQRLRTQSGFAALVDDGMP